MTIRRMNVSKQVSLVVVVGAVALGFAVTGDASAANPNGTKVKKIPSIAPAELKPGQTETFTAQGETKTTYHVYTPTTYQTNAPMLVLFSPGGDGNGMVAAFKESVEAAGWIVVGCDKLSNGFEGNSLEHQVENELLDDILARIPHAAVRLFFGGFSGGAERAYHLSARRKEKIAGIIAMGGWLGGDEYRKLLYCQHMAVAMVNGKKDAAAASWVTKDSAVLRKRSCTIKLFQFEGGHAMPPEAIKKDVIAWLIQQTGGIAGTGGKPPAK